MRMGRKVSRIMKNKVVGAFLMGVGFVWAMAGIYCIWPEILGINLRANIALGVGVNIGMVVIGTVIFVLGAKIGEY